MRAQVHKVDAVSGPGSTLAPCRRPMLATRREQLHSPRSVVRRGLLAVVVAVRSCYLDRMTRQILTPEKAIQDEAHALVRGRYPVANRRLVADKVPLHAMIEAFYDLCVAAHEAIDAEVVRLHDDEGLAFAAIATALGVSKQTIHERYRRVKSS